MASGVRQDFGLEAEFGDCGDVRAGGFGGRGRDWTRAERALEDSGYEIEDETAASCLGSLLTKFNVLDPKVIQSPRNRNLCLGIKKRIRKLFALSQRALDNRKVVHVGQ